MVDDTAAVVNPREDGRRNDICFTFDVEWAEQRVIDDMCDLLDERQIVGTFFVTHDGVDVGHHERGLHPNYRRNGDVFRSLKNVDADNDNAVYEGVIKAVKAFAPEARGVRSHSLLFDSTLLPIYERLGIEYDATLRLELVPGLQPFWKQSNIVEIPTYYADYFDLATQTTGFQTTGLFLEAPGMKVLDFHPNLAYTNAPNLSAYHAIRPIYHDPDRLAEVRYAGRGVRSLLIDVLDYVRSENRATATLGEINAAFRKSR